MNGRRFPFLASFGHAVAGIVGTVRREKHMRFHAVAALVVIVAGICLKVGRTGWLWLAAAIAAVFATELLNTAIERTVDLVTQEKHPLAKAAKDAAAGAVLIAALFAVAVAIAVFGPLIWAALFDSTVKGEN